MYSHPNLHSHPQSVLPPPIGSHTARCTRIPNLYSHTQSGLTLPIWTHTYNLYSHPNLYFHPQSVLPPPIGSYTARYTRIPNIYSHTQSELTPTICTRTLICTHTPQSVLAYQICTSNSNLYSLDVKQSINNQPTNCSNDIWSMMINLIFK
jgi:hypothetical protein